MSSPIQSRGRRVFEAWFGLTEAEEEQARADAGKPWRTAYYVASRDWPVPPAGKLTLDEAYAAVSLIAEQDGDGDG